MKRSAVEGLRRKSPRPLIFVPLGACFESRRGHAGAGTGGRIDERFLRHAALPRRVTSWLSLASSRRRPMPYLTVFTRETSTLAKRSDPPGPEPERPIRATVFCGSGRRGIPVVENLMVLDLPAPWGPLADHEAGMG